LLEGERCLKSEISSLLVEKSSLDARINTLISSRAGEKQVSLSSKLKPVFCLQRVFAFPSRQYRFLRIQESQKWPPRI
jgi:hypothetical protein